MNSLFVSSHFPLCPLPCPFFRRTNPDLFYACCQHVENYFPSLPTIPEFKLFEESWITFENLVMLYPSNFFSTFIFPHDHVRLRIAGSSGSRLCHFMSKFKIYSHRKFQKCKILLESYFLEGSKLRPKVLRRHTIKPQVKYKTTSFRSYTLLFASLYCKKFLLFYVSQIFPSESFFCFSWWNFVAIVRFNYFADLFCVSIIRI